MKWVGMNGGIGSGKSTVAAMFRARGAHLIDVDVLSRELQQPGQPLFEKMVARWGTGILDADGKLDRPALGRIVFGDNDQLAELTAMAATPSAEEIVRRANLHIGTDDVVIMESAMQHYPGYGMTGMILVDAPHGLALQRLVDQRGMTADDAAARIASQLGREERRAKADFVITNDGEIASLEPQVDAAWRWIRSNPDATARMQSPMNTWTPKG